MNTKIKTPVFARSDRAAAVKLSEIVRISESVQARKAKGENILSFGTGEPDFPTPMNIIEAAFCYASRANNLPTNAGHTFFKEGHYRTHGFRPKRKTGQNRSDRLYRSETGAIKCFPGHA